MFLTINTRAECGVRHKGCQCRNFHSHSKPLYINTVCPPELGRVAALHAHIPNIASRTGEPVLLWDDKAGRFINSDKANRLIKPEYRAPWSFPEI